MQHNKRTSAPLLSLVCATLVFGFIACGGDSNPGDDNSGGSSGNSGGGSNGGGGAGGGSGGSTLSSSTKVSGCSHGSTLGDVETNVITPQCATASGCHNSGSAFGSYKVSPVYSAFLNKATKFVCVGEKILDPSDPTDSVMVKLVRDPDPKCKDGTDIGFTMPFNEGRLSSDLVACIVGYANAVSGK